MLMYSVLKVLVRILRRTLSRSLGNKFLKLAGKKKNILFENRTDKPSDVCGLQGAGGKGHSPKMKKLGCIRVLEE